MVLTKKPDALIFSINLENSEKPMERWCLVRTEGIPERFQRLYEDNEETSIKDICIWMDMLAYERSKSNE